MAELLTESGQHEVATVAELEAILREFGERPDGRARLSFDEGVYIETVKHDDGYSIERREGKEARHFSAMREGSELTVDPQRFTYDEMVEMFSLWLSGAGLPAGVRWEPIGLATVSARRPVNRFAFMAFALVLAVIMLVLGMGWR